MDVILFYSRNILVESELFLSVLFFFWKYLKSYKSYFRITET